MQVISSGTQTVAADSVEYTLVDTTTEFGIFVLSLDLTNIAAATLTVTWYKKILTGGSLLPMTNIALTAAANGTTWDSVPILSSFETKVTIQLSAGSPKNVAWSFQKL